MDTHKVVRADGSRVVWGARLLHRSDSTEWRFRGIHAVAMTERGSGQILAQRAGSADEPKRFPGSSFGVRVVRVEPDIEDIAHGGSPFEATDPEQVGTVHGPIDKAAMLRPPPIESLLHSGAADPDPELSDGEPPFDVDADFAATAAEFATVAGAFADYKRPTSADEFATFIRDRIIELTDALPERSATVASGPVVTHVTDEVVYVIEVHTVKNGPV